MLTADRVRELLDYDPATGRFTWLTPTSRRIKTGAFTGRQGSDGYRKIGIDGHKHLAHRVAWLWMTGEWPQHVIDHIGYDGCDQRENRGDNRWANLRDVSQSANGHNVTGPDRRNKSGHRNVSFCKKTCKWRVNLVVRFDTPEQAVACANSMRSAMRAHMR